MAGANAVHDPAKNGRARATNGDTRIGNAPLSRTRISAAVAPAMFSIGAFSASRARPIASKAPPPAVTNCDRPRTRLAFRFFGTPERQHEIPAKNTWVLDIRTQIA